MTTHTTVRVTGVIIMVNTDRGFRFIQRDTGAGDIFFYVRCLSPRLAFDATLQERRESVNVVERPAKGRMAVDIRPV